MVQNVKKMAGFSLAELMVAITILSIVALAMISVTKIAIGFGAQAATGDQAHSIARERISLMQNGEILIIHGNEEKVKRLGTEYTISDTVILADGNNPSRIDVTIRWISSGENGLAKKVTLSGYIDRDVCIENAISAADSLKLSNDTVSEGTLPNTYIGSVTIYDKDSGDIHSIFLDSLLYDNKLFKFSGKKLIAMDTLTSGYKTVAIGVSDCGNNDTTINTVVYVMDEIMPPSIGDQIFSIPENSANGTVVGAIDATPVGCIFSTISQTPITPFTITTTGDITVTTSALLNYEVNTVVTCTVEVSNEKGKDTATMTIDITNINEVPLSVTYSGDGDTLKTTTSVGTVAGMISSADSDHSDLHVYAIEGSGSTILYNNSGDSVVSVMVTPPVGEYKLIVTATDGGGELVKDTFTFFVIEEGPVDTLIDCDNAHDYESNAEYIAGARIMYKDAFMFERTTKAPTVIKGTSPGAAYWGGECWELISVCRQADCNDFPYYNNSTYYYKGQMVERKDKIWIARRNTRYKKPSNSNSYYWEKLGKCN